MKEKFTDLYNRTGIPFQYWCLSVLRKAKRYYQGIPEFPFTHPPSSGAQLGKSSSVDILAIKISPKNGMFFEGLILFSIECKRADPKIKNWIFSGDPSRATYPTFFLKQATVENKSKRFKYRIIKNAVLPGLGYKSLEDLDCCLQGVEFNEALTAVNRDQNKMIYKPLLQANHALNALFCQFDHSFPLIEGLNFPPAEKIDSILFVPIVVTTAALFIPKYDPEKVNIKSGKIDKKDIDFGDPKKWITYEFPLPDYLKHSGEWNIKLPTLISRKEEPEEFESPLDVERSTTFIVNSEHWKDFLESFNFYIQ